MKKKFNVEGMTCAACQAHVQKAVEKLEGVKKVNVNLLSNTMDVEWDEAKLSEADIEESVTKAGYKAYIPGEAPQQAKTSKKKGVDPDLIKLIVSIILLCVLMYVAMAHMFNAPLPEFIDMHKHPAAFALAQLVLTVPVLLIYQKYYINGFKRLFKLSPNMDSLVALGSAASLLYGIYAIFQIVNGDESFAHNLYFEGSAMILTLVSLGKYFEKLSKKRTTRAVEKMMDLAPKTAVVMINDVETVVPIEKVKIGDVVIVKKGDSIPVDGTIVEGSGSIDESNFTGESMPVHKEVFNEVYSSTILANGYIKVRADKVGEDSSISTIIKLVEEAANSKAPISKLADKISLYFVPTVMGISILVLAGWLIAGAVQGIPFGDSFKEAFNFACSILVIACPCALGLATPVAIMVGTGKGAENGLLIKNAEILEKSHFIKTVVLDKTGTITKGKPNVTDYINENKDENLLNIIYSIESLSEHPLANAIIEYCENNGAKKLEISDYKSIEGAGLAATYNNQNYAIGNKKVLTSTLDEVKNKELDELSKQGKTVLYVVKEGVLAGFIAIKDEIKQSSKEAVKELKSLGIKVVMLTGDNKVTAESIGNEVGVDEVISEVLPNQKQDVINSLKTDEHHLVAMVGDGVNDAPALTTADVGIAIGAGSDIAIDAADIVLIRNDLLDVRNAIALSKRTITGIKIGLFWAFFYNCIGILIATGAFYPAFGVALTPMIGSAAMSVSSVFVVCNALTINFFKVKRSQRELTPCDETCPINLENNQTIDTNKGDENMEKITLHVEGMMCMHCVAHVEKALQGVAGVSKVTVSLDNKSAEVEGTNLNKESLIAAVTEAGYEAK